MRCPVALTAFNGSERVRHRVCGLRRFHCRQRPGRPRPHAAGRRAPLPVDSAARRRLRLQLSPRRRALRRQSDGCARPGATRSRAHSDIRAIAPRSRASWPRSSSARGAPADARAAAARARRRRNRRRRHRPAGRRVRRTAVHAAEGAHRAAARAAHRRTSTTSRRSRSSGSTPRITTGRKCGAVRCSTPSSSRAPSRWPTSRARASCRSRRSRWTPASSRPSQELAGALPQTEFTDRPSSTTCAPRGGRASAWRARSRRGSRRCSARTASWSSSRAIPPRSRSSPTCSPASSPRRAARRRSRPRPARRSRRAGHAPQVVPQPDSVSLFRLDGGRRPIRRQGDQLRRSAIATYSIEALSTRGLDRRRRLQPERAAPADRAGHALPHDLLRGRPERAGVSRPAARRLRAVRRADAADLSARDARRCSIRAPPRFLAKYSVPLEDLQPQDESALNQLLESQLPAAVEQSLREAGAQIAAEHGAGRRGAAVARSDARGRGQDDARQDGARAAGAAQQDHPRRQARDETLRRQFMRAQAQAFPQGHPQERTLGGDLLPDQIRSRPGRSSPGGSPARHSASTRS